MKKTILIILLLGFLTIGLTGCGKTKNKFEIGNKSDIEISQNDVTMSIKEKTLTNTEATLILTNNSDKLLRYDEIYEIEIKKDNAWHKINVELEFNLPLWKVKPHETAEIELNWEHGYGKLIKGEYRIIKNVYFENEKEQKFYVSTNFNIE